MENPRQKRDPGEHMWSPLGFSFAGEKTQFCEVLTLGISRVKNRSWELIIWVMATVSLAYGGTYAFTSCIMGFGAVVATGLGIVRKLMSVLLSFILFPKPFGVAHFLGLLSFFSGLLVAWSADYSKATGGAPGGGREQGRGGRGELGWQ